MDQLRKSTQEVNGIEVSIFDGGGIRESHHVGKGFYKFMPFIALKRLAQRYEYGASQVWSL